MYCSFCGKELPDDSRFCNGCGHAVDNTSETDRESSAVTDQTTATAPEHSRQTAEVVLNCVFGALFIVGGILPYFIKNVSYQLPYGNVISRIVSFKDLISSFSYDFSIVCGVLILKRARNMYRGLKVCIVAQLISFLSEIVLWAIGIQNTPYYENIGSAICLRAIIAFMLVVLAVTFICLKKYVFANNNNYNEKINTLGIYLMLSMFGLFSLFSSNLVYNYMGELLSTVWLFVRSIYLCLVLFLNKKANKFVPLSGAVVVAIVYGLAAVFLRSTLMQSDIQGSAIGFSINYSWFSLIGCAVMWVAVFVWDYAVVKETIPKWLEIGVPVSLPFISVVEMLTMQNLNIGDYINMILYLNAAIIILLVSGFVKKETKPAE